MIRKRIATGFGISLASAPFGLPSDAQTLERIYERSDGIEISIFSHPRPLSSATYLLSKPPGYPVVVTYEDPILEHRDDLAQQLTRTGARVPSPTERSFTFAHAAPSETEHPGDWLAFLTAMVNEYELVGSSGRFKVEQSGDVYHIIPTAIRSESGEWTEHSTILDTPISIPRQRLDGAAMVDGVLGAVSEATGETIHLFGRGAEAGFARHEGVIEATDEKARDVLSRTLEAVTQPAFPETRFGWALTYGPQTGYYVLELRGVPIGSRTPDAP